jgi:ankyrin repeat protein
MEDLITVILSGNYPRAFAILRDRKPFIKRDSYGWTPMHAAAFRDDYLLIQPLLRAGCSLTSFCEEGETPVHIAASSKWPRFLDKVLDPSLICIRANNEFGRMPLHSAAAYGQIKAVKTLIGAGVDPDVRDLYGCTVMHYALIYEDQPEMIYTLASQGVPIDQKDNSDDETPLDYALQYGLFASANALIELGADRRRVKRGKLDFLDVPNAVGWAGVL